MFFAPSSLQQAPLYVATGILKLDMRSQSRCLFSYRLELSIFQGSFLPPQSAPAILAVCRLPVCMFLVEERAADRAVSAVFGFFDLNGTFIMEPFKAVIHDVRIFQCTVLPIHRHATFGRHCPLCAILPKAAFKFSGLAAFLHLLERLVLFLLCLFSCDKPSL